MSLPTAPTPPNLDLRLLDPGDDVGVVVLEGGAHPVGHKVAVRPVAKGDPVHKYGHVIGYATQSVAPGDHVHSHNLKFATPRPTTHEITERTQITLTRPERTTFMGYRRSDGRAATRNVIAVVSTVNCSATVCQQITSAIERTQALEAFPAVDAVVPVTHATGCGMSTGPNLDLLRRTLAGYAGHANVGGVLVVSLGCEVNQMTEFIDQIPKRDDLPIAQLAIQDHGGTRATIDAGIEAVRNIATQISKIQREPINASELILGTNCGGSDGWSGITANPALGVASDLLVAAGGSSVLAETPEIYGAEDLLLSRAVSAAVEEKLKSFLTEWEARASTAGESLDNNPSPGNKAGGITTILEKSLGAVAKSGHAPLSAVYEYAEPIRTPGLGFMDTPGFDPVSVTGLIAGGANVICFTTGRGSALGYALTPVIKIATNSSLYARMPDDMDINAGDILTDGISLEEKGLEIYNRILDVASGERTCSEELGYGAQEFVPWNRGLTI